MGRYLAVEQVFSSLGFRRVLAVEKFLPGKPSVPFFLGNWIAGFRGKVDGN